MDGLPAEGDVIAGRYLVWRALGAGTAGAVVQAIRVADRTPVAIKLLRPEHEAAEEMRARFEREAVACARIDHPNVVRLLDRGVTERGAPFLVMEYLAGRDLAVLLGEEGDPGLPSARALHLATQVLAALDAAHAAGVIHRDVKLSNAMVLDDPKDHLKVLDFGISKVRLALEPTLTRSRAALGTPHYMAPEQAGRAKQADARSDVHASGVLLYRLLTGDFPPIDADASAMEDALRDAAPCAPRALAQVLARAMATDPAARFPSARAMSDALAPLAAISASAGA